MVVFQGYFLLIGSILIWVILFCYKFDVIYGISQGLVAGVNAALKCIGRDEFILNRTESYIGVLIDDLTSVGVSEPYRMFTRYVIFYSYQKKVCDICSRLPCPLL